MPIDEPYNAVLERMGRSGSEPLLLEILANIMTPEEASFLLELPASNADLAANFNQDEKTIDSTLHDLARRGLVVASRKGLRLPRDPGPLADNTLASSPEFIPPGLSQLWKDFYEAGWWRETVKAVSIAEKPFNRVIPALKSTPRGVELLPSETVRGIIEAQQLISLVNCSCRVMLRNCDHPVRTCIHFGRRAEYDLFRGSGRRLSTDEAVNESLLAQESGLVTTTANSSMAEAIEFICHCCGCCCLALEGTIRTDTVNRVLSQSRFVAKVDQQTCNGCQDCLEQCYFRAVDMERYAASKRLKAAITSEKCMGCGLCVIKCEVEAITMECVRSPAHIPSEFIRVR
jgi:electron transport complex protein RnfB